MNAEAALEGVSKELKVFLDYAAGKKTKDFYVKSLEEAVKEAKKNGIGEIYVSGSCI